MLLIAREAILYSQFRTAFGVPISSYPMMINHINDLEHFGRRTAAGAFKVYSEFIHFGEELKSGIREIEEIEDESEKKRRFRLRELIMLQKIVVADEVPGMIRKAISFYGGHGIMEDFLSFPRFHRDSLVQELWEGPRNVLLTQIHRDLQRVKNWYPPDEYIRDLLSGMQNDLIDEYASTFTRIINHDTLLRNDKETLEICREWETFSNKLFIAYQDQALTELNFEGKSLNFSKLLRTIKKREAKSH
jgi:hypothetical protein